ncbi:TPA: leucine-rich repeat domain-containing protein [Legionella feeleii]
MHISSDGQTLVRVRESDIVDGSCQIPAEITAIDTWAFINCTNLQTLTLPARVTTIGNGAFCGCTGLKTITLPAGVTTIGEKVFDGCSSLKTITLPAGVTTIGPYAFYNCRNLQTITIPAGVTIIATGAFWGCANLQTITLPAGLKTIDKMAFHRCTRLQTITLPAGITTIDTRAFTHCTKLTSIIIASDDETEVARITHLLPEELRSKVIPKHLLDEATHFQEEQLARLLNTPQANRLYGFFHAKSRCVPMAIFTEKDEQGIEQQREQKCSKLPSDIFLHFNQLTKADNPYYQHAQAAIKREPLPKTPEEFEDYKARIGKLVTQHIDKAIKQARHFHAPDVAKEVTTTMCAPAV